jgi:hypothetical protein
MGGLTLLRRIAWFGVGVLVTFAVPTSHAVAGRRAAYFYHYMEPSHLDRLAASGFDTAIIHWIGDTLSVKGARQLDAFVARGTAVGIEVVPQWILQQPSRLPKVPADRRYTWGRGTVERDIPCPLDTTYWRSALLERADEMLAAAPGTRRIAVDLEMWAGGRHHWDAGACRCVHCVSEYRGGVKGKVDPTRLSGLLAWEEAALERRLVPLLRAFAARHPGVELGVFDLDLEAFPHRALARALARTGVPTADWTECTYSTGSPADLAQARRRLTALGLSKVPVHAGLWLKRFRPNALPRIARGLRASADGWFVFTTYSLWLDPSQLQGPYLLPAAPADYWTSLREANTP